ncbi:MAG: hypothetical protein E7603_08540 [Ruminococcaceae bacterium]|nr:hypothetical protein [Oscillospiraceae bacterium]
MKRNKLFAAVFGIVTVLLLCAMCAVVAFHYAAMLCAMNHCGASAPPEVAFIFAVPFLIGIVISTVLCIVFCKKADTVR